MRYAVRLSMANHSPVDSTSSKIYVPTPASSKTVRPLSFYSRRGKSGRLISPRHISRSGNVPSAKMKKSDYRHGNPPSTTSTPNTSRTWTA
jgi:hypothetical protein